MIALQVERTCSFDPRAILRYTSLAVTAYLSLEKVAIMEHIPPLLIPCIRRWTEILGEDTVRSMLSGIRTARPTTYRTNTIKSTAEALQSEFTAMGVTTAPVPWYRDAGVIASLGGTVLRLTTLPAWSDGRMYLQSLSSMVPPLVLDPQPGERVLDITAAPGSKTSQIAALMKQTGSILANDRSRIRLEKLKANIRTLGITTVTVRNGSAEGVWRDYPEYFDRTLVDVPCSMEGRILLDDERTYRDWSERKIRELAQADRWILRSAVSATKPGGIIVYSTCTLAPEENEAVVDWLIEKENGAVVMADINIPKVPVSPGLTSWRGKNFHQDLAKTIRINPSDLYEGFFVAKLRKLRTTVPSSVSGTH